jgi:hypothetical protein
MTLCRTILVASLIVPGTTAAAQTRAASALHALVRNDYQTAERILSPLAQGSQPDPVAQFFLALLDSGGAGEVIRDCQLYRASATSDHPFTIVALTLAREIEDQVGPLAPLCTDQPATDSRPSSATSHTPESAPATGPEAAGVEAFLRGDYRLAASILGPLIEASPEPNPTLSLLMAVMYENGLGIPTDRIRACASYESAGPPRTPFDLEVSTLMRSFQETLGKDEFASCRLLRHIGFEHGFQDVTFNLAPKHWISFDVTGASIDYDGVRTRIERPLGHTRGTVWLPLQYTELAVGPSRSLRRHFIESAVWSPSSDRREWTLRWTLSEVVRSELIDITIQDLVTIAASAPPESASFAVRELARVDVNDAGDAEWVVAGSRPATGLIETDAERQEVKQERLARDAADARVDWTKAPDVDRVPELAYSGAEGCGGLSIYGWSDDRTEAIAITVDIGRFELPMMARTLAISAIGIPAVTTHVYERPQRQWPFCGEHHVRIAGTPSMVSETWRAVEGTLAIELSPPGVRARTPHLRRATLRITGAEFVNQSGVRIRQRRPIVLTALIEEPGGFRPQVDGR